MQTRCKFQVTKVAKLSWSKTAEEVTLNAVYGGSKENESFAAATPNGTMTFTVDNPNVVGTFEPGKHYYIDLIPADSA